MKTELLIKKGYLYSLWSGKFKVYEGQVNYMEWNLKGSFRTVGGKRFLCSVEPGIVCSAVVWLENEDEELARKILISYEKEKIQTLQEKIDNHLYKIKLLEDE